MMPLHHARKPLSLAGSNDIHKLLALEDIHQHAIADFHRAGVVFRRRFHLNRNLAQKFYRRKIVLGKVPRIALVSRDSFTNSTKPICAAS